jgi:tRNA A58 N-methylase Trm61
MAYIQTMTQFTKIKEHYKEYCSTQISSFHVMSRQELFQQGHMLVQDPNQTQTTLYLTIPGFIF